MQHSVLTDCLPTIPSGNLLHLRLKLHTRFIVSPSKREGTGGWREALTSKMLRSVIIDILIALVVILFWSVLFPLSSPRSSYLLDETQEAVHLSLPVQPGSAQLLGELVEHEWPTPNLGLGSATLPSACATISAEILAMGGGKNKSDMGLSWPDFLFCSVHCPNVQFKKKRERESKMKRKTKRKNKLRSFGLQTASKQNRTKFNKRFSWGGRSPSTRISLSNISIVRGAGVEERGGEIC